MPRALPLPGLPLLISLLTAVTSSPVPLNPPPVLDGLLRDALPPVLGHSEKGDHMVELDMILTDDQWRAIHGNKREYKLGRIALGDEAYRWTAATIPYQIDQVFDESTRRLIIQGMEEWEKYTCINFVPRRNEVNYLYILSAGGCWSNVGMVGGRQELSIDLDGCAHRHIVVHELGHAIGFHHEQTRPDRDEYIRVKKENIASGQEYNFQRYEWGYLRNYGIKYDYYSVMHYGQYAFTRNGQKTIETVDRKYQNVIGSVPGASLKDIQTVNLMYGCSEHCDRKKCPPTAILSEDCKCWCNTGNPGMPVVEWDGQGQCRGLEHMPADTCIDYDDNCPRWTREGQCRTNTNYMLMNCRKSCKVCGPGALCRDFNNECPYWSLIGECENNPGWMLTNCMKSCRVCGNTTTPPNTDCRDLSDACQRVAADGDCETYPDSLLTRCPRSCRACLHRPEFVCRNWHIECSVWAEFGRCHTEADWMRLHCPAACFFCSGSDVPDCKNYESDAKCRRWREEGECGNNPRWMLLFCAKDCRSCGQERACQDRLPECAEYKEEGWCEDEEQRDKMYFYCPVTCNHCKPDKPTSGTCQNFDPDCSSWANSGWCESNPNLMLWHCPKACNICGKNPVCKNYNEMCAEWAGSGECQDNPVWMEVHCADSCDTCPDPDFTEDGAGDGRGGGGGGNDGNQGDRPEEDPDCTDFLDRSFCEQLASIGRCETQPNYMIPNCRKACRVCGTDAVCRDYNEFCELWAGSGQCQVNPGYMEVFCRQSCGRCGGQGEDGSGEMDPLPQTCPQLKEFCSQNKDYQYCSANSMCDTDQMVTTCPEACGLCAPNSSCKDYNPHCKAWAKTGECNRNPGYMKIYCRPSCACC